MDYEIKEKDAFTVVGMEIKTTMKDAPKDCSTIWEKFMPRMHEIKNPVPKVAYGLCKDTPEEGFDFKYWAALEVTKVEDVPEGMVEVNVPKAKYAVFIHKGKMCDVGQTWGKIYCEWFKESKYKPGPIGFEYCEEDKIKDIENVEVELWCQIVDK